MPFSLTEHKFKTWIHIKQYEDLQFIQENKELAPFYLLHHTQNTLTNSISAEQAFLNTTGEPLLDLAIPEDFIWNCAMGPIRFCNLHKTHQIRMVFSEAQERALTRTIHGSEFSPFLWRIIPTDPSTLMPYSKTTQEFNLLRTLLSHTPIIVQGLEDYLNADEVGQEIKIDKNQAKLVTIWKEI